MARSIPNSQSSLTLEQRLANLESVISKGLLRQTGSDNLVAHATGGQANGTPITQTLNRFTTVATIGDSALLMQSADGDEFTVINAGANSMNVFPQSGDVINALGANTAFAVAAGKTVTFYCVTQGQWHTLLSA